jgi:peptidoglycan hydrolase CwlO-like protein
MFDPKDSPWYAGAAAGIFWFFWWVRRLMRRDKEDGSASGLTVAMTDATQNVIKLLESRINDLVKEVYKLRSEVHKLLTQNDECNRLNLKLTNELKELSKRVTVVEKDVK